MTTEISANTCNAVVSALFDAAMVVNSDFTIVAANSAASAVLAAQLDGQKVALFLRSPDVIAAITETLSTGAFRQVEMVVHAKVHRVLDVQVSPLGRGDTPHLALIVLRDRTREAQIEKMRSDFVANASHELRTPLTTLSGFIETMQGAAKNDEKARDSFLQVMKAQADRMSRLIDDLLSLSRIELDEHVAPNARVNLTDVVALAQNHLQSLVKTFDCSLIVEMPKQMMVQGDSNQLGQVVHNLIENALKYSGVGKNVKVLGWIENDIAIVSISDNGPGIASHHVPRLTERFYRVNVQDSRTRGGTGLGLAICKHIINRHLGKLLIQSELGHGSVFSVHLPIAQ